MKSLLFWLFALFTTFKLGDGARILAIYPCPSPSHQFVFRNVMLELHERGHEVVVLTPNPIRNVALKNYTEIDVSYFYDDTINSFMNNLFKARADGVTWFGLQKEVLKLFTHHVDEIYRNPSIRRFYNGESKPKFDLVMIEMLEFDGLYPLVASFGAPIIGITSLGLTTVNQFALGNLILPSNPSNWELESRVGVNLPFWRRVKNFIETYRYFLYYHYKFIPLQQKVAEKYLGNDIPYISDIAKNFSIVFVNQEPAISFARPDVPNVIPIGGLHINKNPASLSKELKEFLDGATQGFIYMSLGSNLKSSALPNKTIQAFLDVFSKVPYRVLWKFEDDTLVGKPDNVITLKWVPQQAVLAHPNIKLFVYQGGLQSTEEAVYNAVPLVGMPVFIDQDHQVQKMVSIGVAREVEIIGITKEKFGDAILDVLRDKRYKERMLELRSLINDRPYDPMENAMWWIEFVIRHKGAPHLHSTTADEPWYMRSNMDVVAFCAILAVMIALLVLVAAKNSVIFGINFYYSLSLNRKKHKIN